MFRKIKKNSNVFIISNDAGGAECLYRISKDLDCKKKYYLDGPAKKIFKKKKSINKKFINKNILNSDYLICSTSFTDKIYYKAIQLAKSYNIYTIVVLDHWTFYKERLKKSRNDKIPDEVIVLDNYANKKVKKLFPKLKITRLPNLYMNELVLKIGRINKKNNKVGKNILYCSEVIENIPTIKKPFYDFSYYKYDEFEALNYFFENIDKLYDRINQITLREHPTEKKYKYKNIINKFKNKFEIIQSKNETLLNQIKNSDVIVGCETYPMAIASIAGKDVFSSVPPGGKKISIPFKNIKYLRDLI